MPLLARVRGVCTGCRINMRDEKVEKYGLQAGPCDT